VRDALLAVTVAIWKPVEVHTTRVIVAEIDCQELSIRTDY
jgi:hypothetical protein